MSPATFPSTVPMKPRVPLRGYALALCALLASLLVVFMYWRSAVNRERQAVNDEIAAESAAVADMVRQRLNTYALVLRGGVSLFASLERPSAGQWKGYVDGLDITTDYRDMMGLGYAPSLDRGRLQDLQFELRDAGQGFYVVRPAGARATYGPILYLEPRTALNATAIGYDMFSNEIRRSAMVAARDNGETRITGRVQLLRDARTKTETPGLLMYAPVFRPAVPTTVSARRAALRGWVYVPLRVQALVEAALRNTQRHGLLAIHDVTGGGRTLLFAEAPPNSERAADADDLQTTTTMVEAFGRQWELSYSTDIRAAMARAPELRMILLIGIVASLLLFGITLVLARTESLAGQKAARLSESYQRSELRFRNAMRFSAIGMGLLNRSGAVVDANPALARIFGIDTDALVGRTFAAQFDDDPEEEGSHGSQAMAAGVHRSMRVLRREDGEQRHLQLTFAPVPGEIGQDVDSLVQVEDVSDRMRAESREDALKRTLEARVVLRTRELTHANHELESFAYSVSHDLRAPLRSIEGFSRLLAERFIDTLGEDGRDYVTRVRKAANRMDDLIASLLTMSRVGRSPLTLAPLDLTKIARDVVKELREAHPQREVTVEIADALVAVGDAVLVRNLLQNVIGNAWKFTEGAPDARIVVERADSEGDAEYAGFQVRDNGAGFPQEYAGKLFRPFQRLHSQEAFAGNGIGLASVKRIVERHGGTIRAEGAVGEGATILFTLPRHMPAG